MTPFGAAAVAGSLVLCVLCGSACQPLFSRREENFTRRYGDAEKEGVDGPDEPGHDVFREASLREGRKADEAMTGLGWRQSRAANAVPLTLPTCAAYAASAGPFPLPLRGEG